MDRLLVSRIVSVAIGAAVLFVLQHEFNVAIYVAIPIATVVYLIVKVTVGLLLGVDKTT